MTLCNFKIARNDKVFIYRSLMENPQQTPTSILWVSGTLAEDHAAY